MKYVQALIGFIIAFLILDGVWISAVALDLYQSQIASIMLDSPRMGFAALFYLIYACAAVWLVIYPANTALVAFCNGAILGVVAYGTYTISNYSMLNDWTLLLVITDLLWGALVTACCCLAGYGASNLRSQAD